MILDIHNLITIGKKLQEINIFDTKIKLPKIILYDIEEYIKKVFSYALTNFLKLFIINLFNYIILYLLKESFL